MPHLCACTCIRHDVSAEQLLGHRWSLEAFVSPCLSWSKIPVQTWKTHSTLEVAHRARDSLLTPPDELEVMERSALSSYVIKTQKWNRVMPSENSGGSALIWAGKVITALVHFYIFHGGFLFLHEWASALICATRYSIYEKNRYTHAGLPHLFHMPSLFLFPSAGHIFWTYARLNRWPTHIHWSSSVTLRHGLQRDYSSVISIIDVKRAGWSGPASSNPSSLTTVQD